MDLDKRDIFEKFMNQVAPQQTSQNKKPLKFLTKEETLAAIKTLQEAHVTS
jgi:hypothetical protein